jgi:diaminopimelate decarboxylase
MSAVHYTGWARDLLENQVLKTPGYYYSVEQIAQDMRKVAALLGTPLVMQLSACPLPDVLSRLPEDVRVGVVSASRAEMNMVIAWATEHAYVHALNLNPQLARAALGAGHRIIVETPRQVSLLAELRGRREVKPLLLGLHPMAFGGHGGGHRGLDRRGAFAAIDAALAAGIAIGGVAVRRKAWFDAEEALRNLAGLNELIGEIEAKIGARLSTMLLGEWVEGLDDSVGLEAYRAALAKLPPHRLALHEAGDTTFSRAGVFVTRVVDSVRIGEGERAICDASLASALLLSEAAGERRKGRAMKVLTAAAGEERETTIVGESGQLGDVFGVLPRTLAAGDVLVIPDAGAWCRTYAPEALQGLGAASAFLLGECAKVSDDA